MRIWLTVSLSALLLSLVGCKPMIKAQKQARLTEDLNTVRQVTIIIQEYALDHGGKLPASLQDLEDAGDIPPELLKVGDGDGNKVKLDYIPGHTTEDPGNTIILHGPARSDGKRVSGYLDGSVKALREADFQAQLQ